MEVVIHLVDGTSFSVKNWKIDKDGFIVVVYKDGEILIPKSSILYIEVKK
ncbi:MAG: hypothetical protein QXG39_08715 [Candidatus Aenigmatarchaeota archaeon]